MRITVTTLLVVFSLLLSACHAGSLPSPTAMPVQTETPVSPSTTPEPTSTPALPTSSPEPTAIPTLPGAQALVQVDPGRVMQTLQTVSGGNFIQNINLGDNPLEPVTVYNLDHLPMKQVRVRMSLEDWEPQNDDNDPLNFNWQAFQDTGNNHLTFLFMQEMQKRGIQIIATTWNIPNWMTPGSSAKTHKFIPYNMYPEVIEAITAWLKYAQDKYGVSVAYISFNEPNMGDNVSLSAGEYLNIIKAAGPRFTAQGLSTRWLLGDTSNFDGSVKFAQTIWEDASVHPYLGPLAVHGWDSTAPDATLQEIADFAAQEGLEVWCTEAGWDPFLYTRPEEFPTWNNALRLATVYSRILKLTRVSVILYWEMVGNDYPLDDGARILWTSPDASGVYSFAATTNQGMVLYLVNTNAQPVTVQVNNLPAGSYTHIQSTEQETGKTEGTTPVTSAPVQLSLPASSINLFVSR